MKLWNRHTAPKDLKYTYIGRGTPWGNPFVVGEGYTQEEAADAYRKKLARALAGRDPGAWKLVNNLAGVDNIVCSCTPRPCHGDCFAEIWTLIRSKDLTITQGIRAWVKQNGYDFGPDNDGKTHINVYTKGKTKLGRMLTNMSDFPVNIPEDGYFQSMEGYWYWLSTGKKFEAFREMNGYEAKKHGKDMPRHFAMDFKDKIRHALFLRCEQSPKLKQALIDSPDLPFKHYYCYGDHDDTVIFPPFDWVTDELEYLRKYYKGTLVRCIIAGSRTVTDPEYLNTALDQSGYQIDEVVCGDAIGADTLGKFWALKNGKRIKYFKPAWETYGKRAGMIRNCEMGNYADCAIILIKDHSKGSTQMYEYMKSLNKPVYRLDVP